MSVFEPRQHFGFLTNRIGRLIGLSVDELLKEHDIHMPHTCVGILAELWRKDGLIQKEIGMNNIKTKSSISSMLDSLEENALIYRKVNPNDKRNKRIFLTQKGKDFQTILEAKSKSAEVTLLTECTTDEIETCKRVLNSLYNNLSAQNFKVTK